MAGTVGGNSFVITGADFFNSKIRLPNISHFFLLIKSWPLVLRIAMNTSRILLIL